MLKTDTNVYFFSLWTKANKWETINLVIIVQKDDMTKVLKHNPKSALCVKPYIMNLMAFA
jgi:hypothetical protein